MLAEDVAEMQRFLMHSNWRGVGLNIPEPPHQNAPWSTENIPLSINKCQSEISYDQELQELLRSFSHFQG